MTIQELIEELKHYPQDAVVYINNDWEAIDDEGHFTNLSEISGVSDDVAIIDTGLDIEEEHNIILETL